MGAMAEVAATYAQGIMDRDRRIRELEHQLGVTTNALEMLIDDGVPASQKWAAQETIEKNRALLLAT